jgi:CRISPR/Cas system endoribonuclease Cas6 (RAMP superfamily)
MKLVQTLPLIVVALGASHILLSLESKFWFFKFYLIGYNRIFPSQVETRVLIISFISSPFSPF